MGSSVTRTNDIIRLELEVEAARTRGTLGEINGVLEDNRVELEIFGEEEKQVFEVGVRDLVSPHAGGDRLLLVDFMKYVGSKTADFRADIDKSVESHRLAFAAENSRLNNGKTIEF